ncbi:MAG: class I SAM-dependent methyltransferase [Limisphaerales bacterium]
MNDFEARLNSLDLTLFQYVVSQTTEGDKRSLLGLQRALREASREKGYVYLEIGSYLGGSLQPYVADPLCRKIISIDPRPRSLADVRGTLSYAENTTENMLRGLRQIPEAKMEKLVTVEEGTETLNPTSIQFRPDFCFVDGEHTNSAVLRDSLFCQSVLNGCGWIAYHDANIVYDGLLAFMDSLQKSGNEFRGHNFEDSIFLIELGDCRLSESGLMTGLRQSSAKGYLWSLHANDFYRQFYNRRFCRFFRFVEVRTWNRFSKPEASS